MRGLHWHIVGGAPNRADILEQGQ